MTNCGCKDGREAAIVHRSGWRHLHPPPLDDTDPERRIRALEARAEAAEAKLAEAEKDRDYFLSIAQASNLRGHVPPEARRAQEAGR